MARCVYSLRYRGIDGFLANMDWSLKHKTEALNILSHNPSANQTVQIFKLMESTFKRTPWLSGLMPWFSSQRPWLHRVQTRETAVKKMKNKNGGRTNTHNSISRESSVTHTVSPARQGSLTDCICTATTIILHTGILSYTQTHTGMHRWEEAAVRVVHLYHQCVLTLAKRSISFKPGSTETSEPGWCDDTTVRWHEKVLYKGVVPPPSYRGCCSKSTYFALVWHLTNPHRSSADSISVRQQTHTHTHLKYSGGFSNNL